MPCRHHNDDKEHNYFTSGPLQYAPDFEIKPCHIDARVQFDIKQKTLDCRVIQTFKVVGDSKSIKLNAVDFLDVRVEGASFVYDGKYLTLTWLELQEQVQATLIYKVRDPTTGMFFADNFAITDHETERCRYWLPCVDYPSSRTTLKFELITDVKYTALANGVLVSEKVDGQLKTSVWETKDYECPSYLICLAVGEFEVVEDESVGGIPLKYFAVKGTPKEDILRSFDKTPAMIKWLQNKLDCPFPWPKYYQVAAHPIGGAMENVNLVTWSERFIMDKTWFRERKHVMDTVNIHEMAHTYFGDLLTIRHFEHVWLKESWATYIESCWIEDHKTKDDFDYEMWINATDYIRETENYMRPMVHKQYASSWCMFDHHTYPGGAFRIHMLRHVLGNDKFWQGVQLYVFRFKGKSVETEDFRKCLEEVSGKNLTRFFDEWFYSKGFACIKASYECVDGVVTIKLEQIQVDSEKKVPLFHINIDVVLHTQLGEHREVAKFDSEKTQAAVQFQVQEAPLYAVIDPDNKVLMTVEFDAGHIMNLSTARSSASAVARIHAYQTLIKVMSKSTSQSVKQSLLQEQFYGVRVAAASALVKNGTTFALNILVDLLLQEQHDMALWQIIKECKVKHEKVRQALLLILKKDIGYRAREYGYENLGYQCNDEDVTVLLQRARDDKSIDQHNFVRGGVLKGLGHSRSIEAYEYLKTRVVSKAEHFRYAQPCAIQALATAAFWQDSNVKRKETIEVLENIVSQHDDHACRMAAINGLIVLEAKSSVDVVRDSSVLYGAQDLPALEAKAQQLEALSIDQVDKKLQKRLEKLEAQFRSAEK